MWRAAWIRLTARAPTASGRVGISELSALVPGTRAISTSETTRPPCRQTVENPVRPMPNRGHSASVLKPRQEFWGHLGRSMTWGWRVLERGFERDVDTRRTGCRKGPQDKYLSWHPANSSCQSKNSPNTSACRSAPSTNGDTDAKDPPGSKSAATSATGAPMFKSGSNSSFSMQACADPATYQLTAPMEYV